MEKLDPPTIREQLDMWKTIDFELHENNYKHINNYIAALKERYSNGQVLFFSFAAPSNPIFEWYFDRSRLEECDFLEKFWLTKTPAKILKCKPKENTAIFFNWNSPFHLNGSLSSILYNGGAYSERKGCGDKAKLLGMNAADELLNNNYEQALFFESNEAWSDFFMDVAWDNTLVVISKSQRLIHVIMATDTD